MGIRINLAGGFAVKAFNTHFKENKEKMTGKRIMLQLTVTWDKE